MKRFVWRLQRVLDIKRKEEQTRKAELVALTEKLTHVRGALLTQKRLLESAIKNVNRKNVKRRLGEQELFLKHSPVNERLIRKLENKVSELEEQQKKKIAELLKIKQYKEGLEKVRAEAKSRFIKEQEKLEQKELEDRATIGFIRMNFPVVERAVK